MKIVIRILKELLALVLMPVYLVGMAAGLVVAAWEKGYDRTRNEI